MENTIQDLKWTPKGKSYWRGNAEYSELMDEKYAELVPDQGIADTIHGEMVRAFGRLQYDYCNNGNGNAREVENLADTCWDCMGSGEDDEGEECDNCCGSGEDLEAAEGVSLNRMFEPLLDFLYDNLKEHRDKVEAVRQMILSYNHANFTDDYMHKYTQLGDAVMHFVLTTENKPNEMEDFYK